MWDLCGENLEEEFMLCVVCGCGCGVGVLWCLNVCGFVVVCVWCDLRYLCGVILDVLCDVCVSGSV